MDSAVSLHPEVELSAVYGHFFHAGSRSNRLSCIFVNQGYAAISANIYNLPMGYAIEDMGLRIGNLSQWRVAEDEDKAKVFETCLGFGYFQVSQWGGANDVTEALARTMLK